MNTRWQTAALLSCIEACTLFLASSGAPLRLSQGVSPQTHAYHTQPPPLSVSDPLDPAEFKGNREAYVSYALAHKIKSLLYQVPCYCPCDQKLGHKSLLDCYRTRHAVFCPVCQKELLFCYISHKSGRTAADIRNRIAAGEAWDLNLEKYVGMFLRELNHEPRARSDQPYP
jgi:hypothetical protein